ncbi:MAG: hypothetical protein AAF919_01480 [Pseudomonadota bacterium]
MFQFLIAAACFLLLGTPAQADRIWPDFTDVRNCVRLAPNLTFALIEEGARSDELTIRGRPYSITLGTDGSARIVLARGDVCAPSAKRSGTVRSLSQREARAAARDAIAANGCRIPLDDLPRFERAARRHIAERIVIRSGNTAERRGLAAAALVQGARGLLARDELRGDPGRNAFLLTRCRP